MLRDALKQEIDTLNEGQLSKIAALIAAMKDHAAQLTRAVPFWQRATGAERVQDIKEWLARLPQTGTSLPDDAFDRDSIYE